MNWIIHPAAFDRIVVNVGNFLLHHRLVLYSLWMGAFLPKLVVPILFVKPSMPGQLLQKMVRAFRSILIDDLPGGKGFKVGHYFVQVLGGGNQV